MPPGTRGRVRNKRKKLAVPKELLDVVDETIDDSDTVVCEINEREFAFMGNTDNSGDDNAEKATNTRSQRKKTSAPEANAIELSAKPTRSSRAESKPKKQQATSEEAEKNTLPRKEDPKVHPSTSNATTETTSVSTNRENTTDRINENETAVIQDVFSDESTDRRPQASMITATSESTATGAAANTSTGAIPKTKAAYKQGSVGYEFPPVTESWNDQMEREERERRRDLAVPSSTKTSGSAQGVTYTSARGNEGTRFTQHAFAQTMPQQRKTVGSIYDQPPRLVIDAKTRSLYGDSAYFQGGEYRKPDTRTIYIEGLERMYQNSLQSTFELLPKETIEYHIKAAEKYWDKFLDAHNQLYNNCETIDEIEIHRVLHRNTQRLNENLMIRLLKQLSDINAEEREQQSQMAHSTARNNRGGGHGDNRNIMNEVKFEKIRIASFDGQYQKWPQFKRIFETYFHNTDVSNSAKMVHLLNHLEGEPQNLISGLDPRGENYEIAWKTICEAYDDERKILDAMVTKFLDIPRVQTPTRASLMHLVTSTKNLIEPMQAYNLNTDSWGVWIVPIIVRKLDSASHSEWCMERPRRVKPEIEPLLRFISNRAEGVEELPQTQNNARSGSNSNNNRFQNQRSTQSSARANTTNASSGGWPQQANKKTRCPDPLCAPNNEHQMFNCPRFKSLDVEHRRQKVRALGICELCLRKGHYSSKCTMKPCNECDERHNSWLCTRKVRIASTVAPPPAPLTALVTALSSEESHIGVVSSTVTSDVVLHAPLLATAIITVTDRNGQKHQLRALCDQGSQTDMITTAAYQIVGHGKTRTRLSVRGIGGKEATSVGQANISFTSRFATSGHFRMTALVLPTITGRLPSTHLSKDEWKHLDGLALADPNFNIPDDIDVVLGAATCASLVKHGLVKGAPDQPIAQSTHIGWVVYGSTHASTRYLQTLHALADITEEARIDDLLTRFWEVENVPDIRRRTEEEQQCEDLFIANTKRDGSGRYVVRIPIKDNAPKLGESRSIAVRRLLQMEARFDKKPELRHSYVEFMAEYRQLGHMIKAPPLQLGTQHNYIPHHAAGTKKFRVVFDGSCKTANGVAFNDIQLIGEKLQPDLTSITMRFRTHKVALTADIKKMYRQILVCPEQRDFQRIVWREDPNKPIEDYQLVTQTYGLRSAPHNCVRALVQCANDNEINHPLAAEITRRDFYIDDMLSGADSDDSAEALRDEMNTMLGKGGFELAKWATNSEHLRSRLRGNTQLVTIDKDEAESSVLGLRWNPVDDVFKYKIVSPNQHDKVTKRRIVSNVAKLYDPNGYVSPVVITAKILIQKLWQSECTWDSKVPKQLAKEYRDFMTELPQLEQLSIPRWIGTTLQSTRELHAFCDASNVAYGCVFYAKTINPMNNDTTVKLIASKTRVAPIKRMTIPRLELCGAHLLAKMLHEICTVHDIPPEKCHLWTDSMIVLYWLHKSPSAARTYVENRVGETSDLTKSCTWRHVPTKDNPADMASRGISAGAIVNSKLWWEGPAWIAQTMSKWPKSDVQLTEEHKASIASESSPPVVLLARQPEPFLENKNGDLLMQVSCLHRLLRITAWAIRFIHNAKKSAVRSSGPLTAIEYMAAESHWVRHEQQQHFAEEMNCPLEMNKLIIPKKSKLFGLNPFIEDGILRGRGRLERSNLPYDCVNPIILSAGSPLTRMIIRSAHIATMHGGTQLTMHYVRQKYWVPAMRRLTRSIIHRCVKCVRQNATSMQQQMAALPKVRITPGRAFQRCGVDYCGPFYVKARGGRCKIISKAYVAVFICMASRAVHLELVSDLTSDAFLAALSRLSSRRGRVHELYSDNGTTFHGADKDVTNAVNSWKKLPSNSMFQALYIKWTFIPPIAPHQGGLWEAAVKSAKHHLRRVVGDQQLTFEEFATVLSQVEACLNSRPITRVSNDATDNLALTPSHSWALEPVVTPMACDRTEVPRNRLQRWKLLQQFVQDFWRRWKDEYLDQLFLRTKWKGEQPNAAIDDVVLVRSENTPPTQWPMGRIVNVYPGNDGLVRSVDVIYGGHTYRRPVTKLVLLPTTDLD